VGGVGGLGAKVDAGGGMRTPVPEVAVPVEPVPEEVVPEEAVPVPVAPAAGAMGATRRSCSTV
jgi:hypothetical protein